MNRIIAAERYGAAGACILMQADDKAFAVLRHFESVNGNAAAVRLNQRFAGTGRITPFDHTQRIVQ
ncbi:hypothetical protein D3C74_409470 [compost metagenome]